MKSLYWVQLLTFAVLVISSTAQAQSKAAVCQSNVEQLQKVVDRMDVQGTMYEATAIFVRKAEGKPAAAEAGVVQVALPGDKPGGISTDVTEITATVEDIDTAKRIVKLKGPEGKIRVLKVGKDVKNLAAVKKGDQVVVRHTEEVAIDVTK